MPEYEDTDDFPRLLNPYPTSLVTCCDAKGKANIVTIAWLIPISYDPPLVSMAIRRDRFSYPLIKATGEFVINVAPFLLEKEALICGRNSGSEVDKFSAANLTPAPARCVHPPIILECGSHLECRLVNEFEVGDHTLLIGEVLAAYTLPGTLGSDGLKDLEKIQPLLHLGKDRFVTASPQSWEHPLHAG